MSMKKALLDRFVAEVRGPVEDLRRQLSAREAEVKSLRAMYDLLATENATMTAAMTKGQLPFSDLYRAADRVVKTTGVARRKALTELKAAMKVANDHIDWIPF